MPAADPRAERTGGRNKFGSIPKIGGHENEIRIAAKLNDDAAFRARFCARVGRPGGDFLRAEAGGLHAAKEESVLGGKTTGKTDLSVFWTDGTTTNVSIKMRSTGQVYLVSAAHFAAVYEAQYRERVPDGVRRALALFIGEDPESRSILEGTDLSVDGAVARRIAIESNHRLMLDVIRRYDPRLVSDLLAFLREKIVNVFELAFAAGAVKDRKAWSEVRWYRNLVDPSGSDLDYLVSLREIKAALRRRTAANAVEPGPQNAGSTIHLPFGHLQYHLKQLEFYQNMKKIQELVVS